VLTRLTRLVALGVAAMVAVSGLAACSRANGSASQATVPVAQLSQRYEAAVAPANAALTTFFTQAVAYSGGPAKGLDALAQRSEPPVKNAAGQLSHVAASGPLRLDIADVASALDAVGRDLTALLAATGAGVEPSVAALVADIGRESAADGLVKLALTAAATPTSLPSVTVPPATDATVADTTTTVETTTTVRRRTTTTRPARTTTTVARTTTTKKP